jgi:hypothetical protein
VRRYCLRKRGEPATAAAAATVLVTVCGVREHQRLELRV